MNCKPLDTLSSLLITTLSSALFGQNIRQELYENLSTEQWKKLFQLSAQQGVLAIVYDVVSQLPTECQPPRNINIQWALSVEAIEKRYQQQLRGAKWLSELWLESGIKTVVIKGFSLSKYYPVPHHRECGDFDCFLLDGRYEDGNVIAERNGATVNREWYKHSQIYCRGIMAENHNYLVTTRKGKSAKELNDILVELLNEEMQTIEGTSIYLPPTSFTALFVTYHSFAHFISEGITLRHLYDWACFIKSEQDNIDWGEFYALCKKFKFDRFVDVSNEIIAKYFGVYLNDKSIIYESPYTERVMNDILYGSAKIYSSGKGKWHNRIKLIKNMFSFGWKHKYIARSSNLEYFWTVVIGYLFKRERH